MRRKINMDTAGNGKEGIIIIIKIIIIKGFEQVIF